MSLSIECTGCFKSFTVPDKLEGETIRCQSCSAPIWVEKPKTLARLKPQSSESHPAPPEPSSSRRRKKRPRRRESWGIPEFLRALDSPNGYLVILIAIMALWFIYMPSGKDSDSKNGLIALFVLALGSRANALIRRGEGDAWTLIVPIVLFIGICAYGYSLRTQIAPGLNDRMTDDRGTHPSAPPLPSLRGPGAGVRSNQTPASREAAMPPNLVPVPAGLTRFSQVEQLYVHRDRRWQPVKVVSRLNDRFQVRSVRGMRQPFEVDRSELYIDKDILARVESGHSGSGATVEEDDLVLVPAGVESLGNVWPVYVKAKEQYFRVDTEYKIGTRWHVKYLEGPFEGREVDRSEIYIDRKRLAELQQPNP